MNEIGQIKQRMQGRFRVMVVDAKSNKVVEDRGWQKNLILDSGLDRYATTRFSQCWQYCSVGTDNTPVVVDSDTITATQAGTTITASGSIFTANDVGRLFRFDTGEESYITTYTSGTEIEVADSRTVGSPTAFAIWRVNQTQLASYSKKSITYFTASGSCGQTTTGTDGKVTMWRTWEFSEEVGSVTYREIGVHPDNTDDDVLFSRVLINGGAVSLNAGQLIRVTYEVTMYFALDEDIVPQAGNLSITGWPAGGASTTDGDYQTINIIYSGVNSNGNVDIYINENEASFSVEQYSEPNSANFSYFNYSTAATALPTFGTTDENGMTNLLLSNSSSSFSRSSYVNGTFTRLGTYTLTPSSINTSSLRHIGVGNDDGVCWIFLFDENQQKLNTHTLILTWRWTWGRVIGENP